MHRNENTDNPNPVSVSLITANAPPLNSYNDDIIFRICSYLNPVDLYIFSRISKSFLSFVMKADLLWSPHLLQQFSKVNTIQPNADFYTGNEYAIFKQNINDYYPKNSFTYNEKICFMLVRANDFYAIKIRKMEFDITLLMKCDAKNHSLFSLIKKNNNPELNEYVADSIYAKRTTHQYSATQLIKWFIKLDVNKNCLTQLIHEEGDINSIIIDNHTLQFLAATNRSINCARLLFDLGADPNLSTDEDTHPLYVAAELGDVEMLDLLLEKKAVVDKTFKGFTALYIGAQFGHLEIVKRLLTHGANINFVVKGSALYIAMQEGRTEVVSFLLQNGADINIRYNGFAPLYVAARNNHLPAIKAIMTHCEIKKINFKEYINQPSNGNDDSTALYVASQNGHTEVCHFLLEMGAAVDCEYHGGYTPLYVASQNGHMRVVKELCRFNPNLNKISPNGSPAIYVAAQNGHTDVVTYLADQPKIIIDRIYGNGYSPLYIACQKGQLDVVKVLVKNKANINHQTDRHATPLYVASQKGYHLIVDFLLENGADHNLLFQNGYSPLHIACKELDFNLGLPTITSLIRGGANPLACSLHGKIISNVAENSEIKKIMTTLEKIARCGISNLINIQPTYSASRLEIIQAITYFTEKSDDNSGKLLAKNCLYFLMDTSTSFGCAVVLYALLDHTTTTSQVLFDTKGVTDFMMCIVKQLGFSSKQEAKNALYTMILSSMPKPFTDSHDIHLFGELKESVIAHITEVFNKMVEITPDSQPIILYLNLFEAKIKKSSNLIAQPNINLQSQPNSLTNT